MLKDQLDINFVEDLGKMLNIRWKNTCNAAKFKPPT